MPTSILARCQEIGNATGMRVLLCLSLALNGLLICLLAARQSNIVCIACQHEFCNHLLQEEYGGRCRRYSALAVCHQGDWTHRSMKETIAEFRRYFRLHDMGGKAEERAWSGEEEDEMET